MSCDVVYSHVIIKVFETFIKLKTIQIFKNPTRCNFKYFNFSFKFFLSTKIIFQIEVYFTLPYHTINDLSFLSPMNIAVTSKQDLFFLFVCLYVLDVHKLKEHL